MLYWRGTTRARLANPWVNPCLERDAKLSDGWFTQSSVNPFFGPLSFVRDYPGEPVPEPIWILLKQETVNGSGISWAMCKSAPCRRHIAMPASHHSVFYRPDALPAAKPTASKAVKALTAHVLHKRSSSLVDSLFSVTCQYRHCDVFSFCCW